MEYRINSYPSVYNLGHAAIVDIFNDQAVIEEKVDGSQFSFAKIDGVLYAKSKNKQIILDGPKSMFDNAIKTIMNISSELQDKWVYRAEYLQKPKHNVLTYERIPNNHLVIFDICPALECYLSHEEKVLEAKRLGLEVVPILYYGMVDTINDIDRFLSKESFLGGTLIEGIVIKRYDLFTKDKKAMIGKFVSEKFKEKHNKEYKKSNSKLRNVVAGITNSLRTEARWQKAIQHLKDNEELELSPRDIGKLIKEIQRDVYEEELDYISDVLTKYAWNHIRRGITAGFPEWYKKELAKDQFK